MESIIETKNEPLQACYQSCLNNIDCVSIKWLDNCTLYRNGSREDCGLNETCVFLPDCK